MFMHFRDIKPANIMKLGQGGGDTQGSGTMRKSMRTMTSMRNITSMRNVASTTEKISAPASNTNMSELPPRMTGLRGLFGNLCRKFDAGSDAASNTNTTGHLIGNIEFVQVTSNQSRDLSTVEYTKSSYKLIDLGTAVGVHEIEDTPAADSLMTISEMAFAG
jgi:hypothetical protein